MKLAYLKRRMISSPLLDHKFNISYLLIFLCPLIFANCQSDDKVKKDGQTLEHRFFRAVDAGNTNEIESCLQEGLPIDKKDPLGNSALIHAVDHENVKLTQLLIDKGANINLRNLVGETALYRAVFRGNLNLVKLLVEKGAEIKIKNVEGVSPIQLADERGEEAIQNFLEKSLK